MDKQSSFDLFDEQAKYLKGTLLTTIFFNQENLYTVARIRVHETNESYDEKEAIITGTLPPLYQDERYIFFGHFKEHPKYGKQYHVTQFRKDMPQTKEGMVQYLSGDLFHGIGKKTAEAIVNLLGENAISAILENPDVLNSIPQLNEEKAKNLYDVLIEHQGLEQVMVTLNPFGIGPQLSMKIYQTYKEEALHIIQNNPYQLIYDIEGIGFQRADELGKGIGLSYNHPERIRAGCLYILQERGTDAGHVYLPSELVMEEVKKLLTNGEAPINDSDIFREIEALREDQKIVMEDDRLYLPSLYFSEKGLAESVTGIASQEEYKEAFPHSEFLKALGELEERLGIEYAPSQKQAIETAVYSPIMVLTGGPGTGKTTVIKGIVEVYAELHGVSLDPSSYKKDEPFPVLLVAPTGRAAKRMSESTGIPAFTIHRLLGWKGGAGFEHSDENPLEGKLLIVDEMSMVDIWLAHALFKAVPGNIQIIIVGDEDQLPSVGPGQVLRDLIASNVIPTVELKDIYRQAEGSSIIELAHNMKNGVLPNDLRKRKADRSFFSCQPQQVLEVVKQVCQNARQKGYTPRDIQVLAPMYKGNAGIDILNQTLQELFNPSGPQKRELNIQQVAFRVGDKVLQLVNQPEDNVYNGDMGEIVSIIYAKETTDKEDQLVVAFDDVEVVYTRSDFHHITHAYCCSIHKSQGSEFPIVIMPVVKSYFRMLRRNLIYTGITRSREFLILCGEESAFELAVQRNDESARYSRLKERLTQFNMENVSSMNP
ncbi:ATP-dependent RecD-like DNA helicase [Fictibacillus sp. KIGAM418]|uniref:ATP-dependent RecD2 DNA helicase n=1 Tax=Fictibacillus marinisediminis TaxID=2878389 RepID=A0A9X1XBX2_9BACL|nr:ATP-dependent RecD-like DNA helicase [Fictibacillus marinisediminis]MCK6257869.1 ATP-dependent RecD-like DNA helicase [Fictibacillus marinisediminis]